MHIFFDGWEGIVRTLILGILAYVMIVTYLRLSGLRTLSKMNAFDFIVTIALGSTLASILLSKEVTLAEGTVAVGTLVGLQFLVTWISVRARWAVGPSPVSPCSCSTTASSSTTLLSVPASLPMKSTWRYAGPASRACRTPTPWFWKQMARSRSYRRVNKKVSPVSMALLGHPPLDAALAYLSL